MTVPMGLLATQLALQEHVLNGSASVAAAVKPGRGLDIDGRLAIYRHAYRMRLRDAVREGHEHTACFLGEEKFEEKTLAFVESHPSEHPSLRWYAAEFADWLGRGGAAQAAAAELASLDWALRCAFDGPDATPLTLNEVAAVPADSWERVGFQLLPTAARLRFRFNTLPVWQAIDDDRPSPGSRRMRRPVEVLVWRRDLQPHFRSLAPIEALALDCTRDGLAFGATCEALAQASPDADVAAEAGAMLRRWIEEELIWRIDTAPSEECGDLRQ